MSNPYLFDEQEGEDGLFEEPSPSPEAASGAEAPPGTSPDGLFEDEPSPGADDPFASPGSPSPSPSPRAASGGAGAPRAAAPRTPARAPEDRGARPIHIANAQQGELDALPTLKIINGRLAQQLALEWGQLLGESVEVELMEQRLGRWAELLEVLPDPGCYQLVEADALGGYAMLGCSQELFFGCVDRLFGGTGSERSISRQRLTTLEQHSARKLLGGLGRACERAWKPVVRLQIVPGRLETRPAMTSAAQAEEVTLLVNYQLRVAQEYYGEAMIIIPKSGIVRHRELLSSGRYERTSPGSKPQGPTMASILPQVNARVHVELGRAELTLGQVRAWQLGQVIRLDQGVEEPLRVCVEGVQKFRGVPGQRHGNLAVTLLDPDHPHEP